MRGTIILWAGDHGTVAAGGRRYEFDIDHWQGNVAPATNMTGEGRKYAQAVFADVGKDVAIGYGAFLFIALFVTLATTGGPIDARVTLADLLSGGVARAALGGGSGRGVLIVLLATATIAVPYFWKHRLAPLAFTVPLFFTAMAFVPLYREHRRQQEAVEAMGGFGEAMPRMAEEMGAQTSAFDTIGMGAWLLVATVIFLAFKGIVRCLARGQGGVTSWSAS